MNQQMLVGLSAASSVIVPYVAAALTRAHYPRWTNELIATVLSLVAGTISFLTAGGHFQMNDVGALMTSMSAILVASKLYYAKLAAQSPVLLAIQWLTGTKDITNQQAIEATQPRPR